MKKIGFAILLLISVIAHSQVGIGTSSPNNNAILDLVSNSKGFLPTRLTTAQRDAINPKPAGLMIYNTDLNCMQYWNTITWRGRCNGTVTPPTITSLNCGSATFSPSTIIESAAYSGTMTVPYTGGNGQAYPAGTPIASTGVTGLTATLQAGTLANGSGTLTYTVSGTPSGSGTASFAISFNGASNCTAQKAVNPAAPNPASVATLNCGSASFNPSTMTAGTAYSGTITVPYTGGNGQAYPAGTPIASTGVTGLTATLQAGTLANGSGNLTYTVSGTPSGSGTASFAINFNGASGCTVQKTVNGLTPSITSITCGSATFSPAITANTPYVGTLTVPYTGGNGQSYPAGAPITSYAGPGYVGGLTATLRAGTLANGSGTLVYDVTGTTTGAGQVAFYIQFNGATGCYAYGTATNPPASVTSITCGSAVFSPSTMTAGTAYVGTMTVPYTGGNGQAYPAGASFSCYSGSGFVTGLTAKLRAGTLANGSGTLVYDVTGTPSGAGQIAFNIQFNGASSCYAYTSAANATPSVASLDCTSNSGRLSPSTATVGTYYTGTFTVYYTGGNGQSYPTGVTYSNSSGLTYKRRAGTLANGSGTIIYDVSGTPTNSGTFNFTASFNGAASSCTKSLTVYQPGPSISSLNCGSATFSPSTMTKGTYYSGTMKVPYSGGNGQSYSSGSSYTVNGLTIKLQGGTLANGSGYLTYTVTGTPTNSGTFNFPVKFGGTTYCNVQKTVAAPAQLTFDCQLYQNGGVYTQPNSPQVHYGDYYSKTFQLRYTNGSGQYYPTQQIPVSLINSSGNLNQGLTATIIGQTLNNGPGEINVQISGTLTPTVNTYNPYDYLHIVFASQANTPYCGIFLTVYR